MANAQQKVQAMGKKKVQIASIVKVGYYGRNEKWKV